MRWPSTLAQIAALLSSGDLFEEIGGVERKHESGDTLLIIRWHLIFSFDASPTKKRTKGMTKKMMTTMTTRPTRATRSEQGTSYRKTADEENEIGCASVSLDRWQSREPSRAYSQCHQPWRAVGWLSRRD